MTTLDHLLELADIRREEIRRHRASEAYRHAAHLESALALRNKSWSRALHLLQQLDGIIEEKLSSLSPQDRQSFLYYASQPNSGRPALKLGHRATGREILLGLELGFWRVPGQATPQLVIVQHIGHRGSGGAFGEFLESFTSRSFTIRKAHGAQGLREAQDHLDQLLEELRSALADPHAFLLSQLDLPL